MKKFMDDNFLLNNETSQRLYNLYLKDLPIVDYHCHISPQEIYENNRFNSISEVWLKYDHYKWKQMRGNGISEEYITGNKSDYEKFEKWVLTLEKLIGNPLYHWSHLELKRYFEIDEALTSKNCKQVYEACNEKLKTLTPREIIEKSNVKLICTTDDPLDDLKYHQLLKADKNFKVKVLPCFRPDKAINIENDEYVAYVNKFNCKTFNELCLALKERIAYFNANGCKASDHGIEKIMYSNLSLNIEEIFNKRMNNQVLNEEEIDYYKTEIFKFLSSEYKKRNWVMQIHYGVVRNVNDVMFNKVGADTGFDTISSNNCSLNLVKFLNLLNNNNSLGKIILYSLNPNENAYIASAVNCFMDGSEEGQLQHGTAWWFNDNKSGMINQITTLASLGNLGNFIGMLTDSRSFLSYTRHEYFRRILCNLIGEWVENGEYPSDEAALKKLLCDISYYNTVNYFQFEI